ncbi:MAG: ATP-binding cassette domain-containing protein [Gammaproteobacteria bacterium]|nr:ATP-binding cassette domain-containing protein [Gammaproteobacteria bacterium]MDH3769056.1 ATP-binding cassette domain-containing protein [Gammaproteobacteria bacterium]
MNERSAAVVFDSVTKSFDGRPVISKISLALPAQRVTAIVGESGSGKSTLLEHINGLHRPDDGTVTVLDQRIDYSAVSELRKRIGYAVQGVGLFPHLSAGDNTDLLAQLNNWGPQRIVERRQRLMRLMELEPELASRFPHQLSGGQQQRFGLCRAMMLEPPLLLLDEPFSGVDPITRLGIHREFLQLQETEPTTVVLVTHDLREAQKLAQYLVIIRAGRIVQSGPTAELIAAPGDDYVARLFREHLQ